MNLSRIAAWIETVAEGAGAVGEPTVTYHLTVADEAAAERDAHEIETLLGGETMHHAHDDLYVVRSRAAYVYFSYAADSIALAREVERHRGVPPEDLDERAECAECDSRITTGDADGLGYECAERGCLYEAGVPA